jgi:hypothetical protein
MPPLRRWLSALMLLIGPPAYAGDLPGPWVELASDGGLDVRSITAPGMDCPKVVADGTTLTGSTRGKPDGVFPVQVCIAHAAAATRGIRWRAAGPRPPGRHQADRGDRRYRRRLKGNHTGRTTR